MATNKRLIKSNDEGGGGASFNTVLYNGNGTTQSITDVGFQPDLIWVKNRLISGENHLLSDVASGFGKILFSNLTNAQVGSDNTYFSQLPNGFSINTDNGNISGTNNYVAWCWKAGGSAVTNTDGTITSQVSANTEAGFSIVSYYLGTTGVSQTIGHGLNSEPKFIITKQRDGSVFQWTCYHESIGINKYIILNSTAGAAPNANVFPDLPTENVFTLGSGFNTTGTDMITYCFAEVAGFSKFGSYDGNGLNTGDTIDCGFEPAFVMIKASTYPNNADYRSWTIYDNKRNMTGSETTDPLFANRSYQEGLRGDGSSGAGVLDFEFLPNGFRSLANGLETNTSGVTYIFMAFANQF